MFPGLVLKSGGVLHSESVGTPSNGNNTFLININPRLIDNTDWLDFQVVALGTSVTDAVFVSISPDKTQATINFTQTGVDQARVIASLNHTLSR